MELPVIEPLMPLFTFILQFVSNNFVTSWNGQSHRPFANKRENKFWFIYCHLSGRVQSWEMHCHVCCALISRVICLHLTGVHAPFEDSGTQHPACDLVTHQALAHRAVDDPNLCLLQDGRSSTWRTTRRYWKVADVISNQCLQLILFK